MAIDVKLQKDAEGMGQKISPATMVMSPSLASPGHPLALLQGAVLPIWVAVPRKRSRWKYMLPAAANG